MKAGFLQQERIKIVFLGLAVVLTLSFSHEAAGQSKPAASVVKPLELSVVYVPGVSLAPTASGGVPSNGTFTFTSQNGPFCIQGLVVSASPTAAVAAKEFGDVWINLEYIDGIGLSHPYVTLGDGTTGGFSAYDLVLNYGGPICAAKTVQFHLIQWPAQIGSGTTVNVFGQAIVSTASGNAVTVK
ncbi:MAG: hypothetical protein ABSC48_03685 [Terracidiphilus sp.]|jgi:hypothetical protein